MHLRSAASRKQPGTATNSQVLCCFRRRMPTENPASLRRTTDTWLIFCRKKQQKQPERGSAPKNETRCRKAKSRSSACAGWRASAAPAITASGRPARRVSTTPRRATRSSAGAGQRPLSSRLPLHHPTAADETRSALATRHPCLPPLEADVPGQNGLEDRRVSPCRSG
jgi:hypothetical protein